MLSITNNRFTIIEYSRVWFLSNQIDAYDEIREFCFFRKCLCVFFSGRKIFWNEKEE